MSLTLGPDTLYLERRPAILLSPMRVGLEGEQDHDG